MLFLTTPHRWITLILVATDPDRRGGRSWLFVSIALIALVVVLGEYIWTGRFWCLAVIDYVWNYWHYDQHGGVFRMYSRAKRAAAVRGSKPGACGYLFFIPRCGWPAGVPGGWKKSPS